MRVRDRHIERANALNAYIDYYRISARVKDMDGVFLRLKLRAGSTRLNRGPSFLSGISADSHAASLTVGNITA